MPRIRQLTLLTLLTISLVACQFNIRIPERELSTPSPTQSERAGKLLPAVRKTVLPSPTVTLTPQPPTLTPSPQPTNTATQTVSVAATPLPQSVQLHIFQELWTTVKEEYLYPDFNGLDWDEIHTEYRQRIEAGLTNNEFYEAMNELIMRLGDDHSVFLRPDQAFTEQEQYQGNYDYAGIGVLLSAVPERERAVILLTFPGSPAEAAGLRSRDSLLRVDGEPILDEHGFLRDIVRGPEGTPITLTIQTPGQPPRQVTVIRQRITSSLPVPYQVLVSPAGKRIGYLLLTSFADSNVDEMVGIALQSMNKHENNPASLPLDGLIIDNTQNGGGADTVFRPTLAYFTRGTLGYFISRDGERPLEIKKGVDINGSQSVPLVVLIGLGTVSYGEVFAGILQDVGRAYLIGETTEGNIETLWGYDFEDGSRAWLAHETFRPLNHPEQNWEASGVVPDLTILANWDEYTLENDPLVIAALNYFDNP